MRIVIKPAGLALVLSVMAVLVIVAFSRSSMGDVAVSAAIRVPASPNSVDWFHNGGLEGDGAPASHFGDPLYPKARLSGQIAEGWQDNSDWADLTVRYALVQEGAHGGRTCQRIDVGQVREGRLQFVNRLQNPPAGTHHLRAWLRASRPTRIEVGYRDFTSAKYEGKPFEVGTTWQEVKVSLPVPTGSASGLLIFGFDRPNSTVWIDDVSFEPSPR